MKAEIITTGTELLLGEITDTNSPFIAGELATLGIDLFYTSTVGDNYERLLGALRQAWQRSDIIILTGGLGPTQGDITRDVIAALLEEKPEVDEGLEQDLIGYFARTSVEMPLNNIKQATLIPSARALRNRQGTAPGWYVERDGRIIVALPGPPRELQAMWQNEVLPRIETKAEAIILSRNLKTLGLSEAKLDQMVSPFLPEANPTLAIYAKPDGIRLRITAKAASRALASQMIAEREAELRGILKDHVWGADNDTLEGVTAQLLRDKKMTLAIAESFTGGNLSCALAGTPWSSDYFRGSLIAVTAEAKIALGLDSQLATEASAKAAGGMASLVRARFGADIGIAVDGSNGAGDVGTAFIAIDNGQPKSTQTLRFRQPQLVRRATNQALFNLRAVLLSL